MTELPQTERSPLRGTISDQPGSAPFETSQINGATEIEDTEKKKQAIQRRAGAEREEIKVLSCPRSGIRQIFAIDYRSLALFRICFSLILLVDLFQRSRDLDLFYTDSGALTRAEAIGFNSPWAYSLYFINGTWQFQALLFAITALIYVGLLVGRKTELMSVLSWIMLISLHRRNPQVLQGGDNLIRCLSFWTMFVPLGRIWSVDSRDRSAPVTSGYSSAATAFLILQILVVYIFSFILKNGYAWRGDQSAVYYALSVDQLTKPLGQSLLPYRKMLTALTWMTLALESIGAVLPLVPYYNSRFRIAAVTLFLIFHFSLYMTMELGPFPWICMAMWLLLIPSEFWCRIFTSSAAAARTSFCLPLTPPLVPPGGAFNRIKSSALAGYFVLMILWNVRTLDFERLRRYFPVDYNFVIELVGLDQHWGMFAPYPMNWDGWYLIQGRTKAGKMVNLSPGAEPGDPITDERPAQIGATYSTERWRKYMIYLATRDNYLWRGSFIRGLVNRWIEKNPGDPLQSVDMFYWFERTLDEGSTPAEKIPMWHYEAPPASG